MVTGVETAGLVLAVLPLIVEAIKFYKHEGKTLKRTLKYRKQLDKLLRSVKEQKSFFEDDLEALLYDIYPEFPGLVQNSNNAVSDLRSEVSKLPVMEYFGPERYEQFEERVEEVEVCLLKLAKELYRIQGYGKRQLESLTLSDLKMLKDEIDANKERVKLGLPAVERPASLEGNWFTNRVRFYFAEDDIEEITNDLDSFQGKLEKLLTNRRRHHENESRARRLIFGVNAQSLAFIGVVRQIRAYANRLFDTFQATWSSCCHHSHEAMLCFDTPFTTANTKTTNAKLSCFKFRLFLRECEIRATASPTWCETTVTVSEEDVAELRPRVVQFHLAFAKDRNESPTITLSTQDTTTSDLVHDLCNNLAHAGSIKKCLDLQLQSQKFSCKGASSWPPCESVATWDTINLDALSISKLHMSPKQKPHLALKLAASVLQLKTTQWVGKRWSKKNIYFREELPPAVSPQIVAEHPFVLQSFPPRGYGLEPEQVPWHVLLELGILLMEIWTKKALEEFVRENYTEQGMTLRERQGRAREWHDSTNSMMTPRFSKAVKACVNFSDDYRSWDDENVLTSVCADIIRPLRQECGLDPQN